MQVDHRRGGPKRQREPRRLRRQHRYSLYGHNRSGGSSKLQHRNGIHHSHHQDDHEDILMLPSPTALMATLLLRQVRLLLPTYHRCDTSSILKKRNRIVAERGAWPSPEPITLEGNLDSMHVPCAMWYYHHFERPPLYPGSYMSRYTIPDGVCTDKPIRTPLPLPGSRTARQSTTIADCANAARKAACPLKR